MSEARTKILQRLQNGPVAAVNGSLHVEGVNPDALHEELVQLNNEGRIKVHGPSAGYSDFGVDPEIFYLPQHQHLVRLMPEY
ncbi:hypothetical protein VHN57_02360 [Sphingobium sp. WW5]|uniref:hypothetical protein n=1 Tax=unclassified Sphingobium TaxID=2611147 RepID=UPI003C1E366A